MQEGLGASLLSSLSSFSFVGQECLNVTKWYRVSLFSTLPHTKNTRCGNQGRKKCDTEQQRKWKNGNKMRGMFISAELMGRISLCMSHTQREHFLANTQTHTASAAQHGADSVWGINAFSLPKVLSWPGFTTVEAHYADVLTFCISAEAWRNMSLGSGTCYGTGVTPESLIVFRLSSVQTAPE